MPPSWELQGGDQSPLLPVGVGPDWRLALGPYLILWPLLVGWSIPPKSLVRIQPCRELEHQCEREPGIPSGGTPPHSSRDSFAPAWPSLQSSWLKGPAWLESCWGLQKCCRNQYLGNQAPHLESWRMQVYYAGRPRGVTLQVLSPEQRGYRVFIHEQA